MSRPVEPIDTLRTTMTILVSIFGFAGRIAGDLLTSALGWASSLLFGRVPRSHQVYLVWMMAGSFLWLVLLLAFLLPGIASFLVSVTPHPTSMNTGWLDVAIVFGVVFVPLGIGVAGYLVPAEGERPNGTAALAEVLRGYLLAPVISGLLIFLACVGIARKVRSKRQGWSDVHVPIVAKLGGYDQLVVDLRDALAAVDLKATAEDAPWVLTWPAWLLARVAGSNVGKLRADRLQTLTASNLNVGVYPSDIAISGPDRERTRARAAVLTRLATSSAHLTVSAEAQEIEDELERVAGSGDATHGKLGADASAALEKIDRTLLELAIPTDEWDILYRLRMQIERDLLAGAEPGKAMPGRQPEARETSSRGTPQERVGAT